MAQVVKRLPSKSESLSSNPSTTNNKETKYEYNWLIMVKFCATCGIKSCWLIIKLKYERILVKSVTTESGSVVPRTPSSGGGIGSDC
jgi:hypothetical protein